MKRIIRIHEDFDTFYHDYDGVEYDLGETIEVYDWSAEPDHVLRLRTKHGHKISIALPHVFYTCEIWRTMMAFISGKTIHQRIAEVEDYVEELRKADGILYNADKHSAARDIIRQEQKERQEQLYNFKVVEYQNDSGIYQGLEIYRSIQHVRQEIEDLTQSIESLAKYSANNKTTRNILEAERRSRQHNLERLEKVTYQDVE